MSNAGRKKAVTVFFVFFFSTILASCSNTGLSFLDDVYDTFCCFSPAMVLTLGIFALSFHKKDT